MELKEWMEAAGKTPESLSVEIQARGARATGDLIRKVLARKRRFGIDTIHIIQDLSEGNVTFNDLYIPPRENGGVLNGN